MIENLELQDSDKYIRTTIDNTTLEVELKKIKKLPTKMINLISDNVVPIFTEIPISIAFYSYPYPRSNTYTDDIINFDIESDINIIPMYKAEQHKVNGEWEFQNIFVSYDEYLDKENLSPIAQGDVTLQIIDKENNIVIEQDYNFTNGKLEINLANELSFGQYTMRAYYHGNKYYKPCTLSYDFFIQKRKLGFQFDKDAYSGNPLENIDIQVKIYDILTHRIIPDCYVNYIFNDENFLAKTNINGYISITLTLPEQEYECKNDIISYPLQLYIDNDIYLTSVVTQDITINKLDTQINAQIIPSSENETEFYINGNVIAKNYDALENVKHGDVLLYFSEEQQFLNQVSSDGIFNFTLDATDFQNIASNDFITEAVDIIKKIKTNVQITANNTYDIGKEFAVKAKIQNLTTTDIIDEGIVVFSLMLNNEIITQYTAEVDSNGESFGYFYPSTKNNYTIRAEYLGMFEYQNATASKNIKIK